MRTVFSELPGSFTSFCCHPPKIHTAAASITDGSVVSFTNLTFLASDTHITSTPPELALSSLHRPRAHEAPRFAPPSTFVSSPRFQNVGPKPFDVALGQASSQGKRLSAAIQQSLEGLKFWLPGGGGKNSGGGHGGGGHSNGDPWGEGDMGRVPDAESAIDCLGHDDGEVQQLDCRCEEERFALSRLDAEREYLCSEVEVVDEEGLALDEDPAPYAILEITPGCHYRKVELEEALSRLLATGWYERASMHWVAHSGDAIKLTVLTQDAVYCRVSSFQCINISPRLLKAVHPEKSLRRMISPPCLLPKSIQREISMMLQASREVSKKTLSHIQERIETWYHNHGYIYAKVKSFRNPQAGPLECHVDEGIITQLSVSCEDERGEPTLCHTNPDIVLGKLPLAVREGMQYNLGAGKAAVNRVEQLGLFEKVSVLPAADPECGDGDGISLHILVRERPLHSASISTEWSVLCNDAGRPNLRTLQPGGSLCVQHRNICGLNRSVSGSIATSNLQRPEDDLRFKLEYVHPYVGGLQNPHDRTLRVVAFNRRKLSALFSDVEKQEEVPAVWIDRAGLKACLTEKLSRQSKFSYGVAVEEVATRDDAGTICNQRGRSFSGRNGPTVGAGSTGVDHVAFLQMKITRSNLQSGETGMIGARDIFQVDQGLGMVTHAALFNKHQLAVTRYIPLQREIPPTDQLPSVAVLHARYGGCLGDVPSYRSFTNGGPYALRVHNTGELASYSRFIEVAGEVRVPVQQVEAYGFFESLTNLQNFGAIWNNPRTLVGRVGKGIMYGAGMKMGNLRLEYVIDCDDQTGSLKVYTGERY